MPPALSPAVAGPEASRGPGGRRHFLLVTGMPRSGTTGVGAALGHAAGSAYLYEPLNPRSGLMSVKDYFLFAGAAGPDDVLRRQLHQVFSLDLRVRRGVWSTDPLWRRAVKTVTGSRSRASVLRCRFDPRVRTVIWKDPFASFLVPTLRETYGIDSVVTVRSPEASAASFKRLGWGFDLDRVRDHLEELTPGAPYLSDLPHWEKRSADSVTNGALLWRLLYGYLDHVLPTEEDDGPSVLWVNSRDLIDHPLESYEEMYDALGLPLTPAARATITREYRDEGTAAPSDARAHDRHRNVHQANSYWHDLLDERELAVVREVTADVARHLERRVGALD